MTDAIDLVLRAPLRDQRLRVIADLPTVEDPRITEGQADRMEAVILTVLDGLDLTPEQRTMGLRIAAAALREAAGEDQHHEPVVTTFDHHGPAVTRGGRR